MPSAESHKRAAALAERDAAKTRCEAAEEELEAALMKKRPSVQYRPSLRNEGDLWCAYYGPSPEEGCVGFGETPEEAMREFDKRWRGEE